MQLVVVVVVVAVVVAVVVVVGGDGGGDDGGGGVAAAAAAVAVAVVAVAVVAVVVLIQCFDTVGWMFGTVSSLEKILHQIFRNVLLVFLFNWHICLGINPYCPGPTKASKGDLWGLLKQEFVHGGMPFLSPCQQCPQDSCRSSKVLELNKSHFSVLQRPGIGPRSQQVVESCGNANS